MRIGTRRRAVLPALLAALLITACGGDSPDSGPQTGAPVQTTETATTEPEPTTAGPADGDDDGDNDGNDDSGDGNSDEAQATTAPPPEASCADLTGEQALARWLPGIPPFFDDVDPNDPNDPGNWSPALTDTSTYDPCADLSWLTVPIVGGTVSSPFVILLFHEGEFVGTATETPLGFWPEVARVTDGILNVTYTYPQEMEANAQASGRAVWRLTWDDEQGDVVRTGDLPPYADGADASAAAGSALADIPDAYPGAGGPAPATALQVQTFATTSPGTAIIITPTGNIGCDLGPNSAGCAILSLLESPTATDAIGDPLWWVVFEEDGQAHLSAKGDPPAFESSRTSPQVVEYGQQVQHQNLVCASEMNGLTCWDVTTGHGAFINRDGVQSF
ncbi:LppP/LprE family lipoprotein [Ornithinimicrobium sp. Y1694]|uniref:LppP/LprE family lipoprotein n=1 Tax=Ornithinimicrobium sp. Y1694 TaxID=3418590 RepID=UPI003CF8007D